MFFIGNLLMKLIKLRSCFCVFDKIVVLHITIVPDQRQVGRCSSVDIIPEKIMAEPVKKRYDLGMVDRRKVRYTCEIIPNVVNRLNPVVNLYYN